MKKLFLLVLVLVLVLDVDAQSVSTMTRLGYTRPGDLISLSVSNGGSSYSTRAVGLGNLFNATNQIFNVGDYTSFRTIGNGGNAGQLAFSSTAHGGGHGVLILGATTGDVVVNPDPSSGVFQIGTSGLPGNWIYLQYGMWPYIVGQTGFSHPLEFRSKVNLAGTVFDKQPGLVGYPQALDGSKHGRIVAYSISPHWNQGNTNVNAPDIAGSEVVSFGSNGVVAASGIKFIGNGGSLTNDAGVLLGTGGGGGSGLTTNIVVMSAGQPLVQYFTNGSLQVVTTDTDASNYIAAVIAAGATLTDNQKLAVTKFTVQRKWLGTWSDSDVIAPFIGGTSNAHAIYLKGTAAMTWTNTPTHDSNGVTFNGSSSFANTGWKSSDGPNYGTNSGRILLVVPTASATFTTFSYLAGSVSTSGTVSYQSFFRNTSSSIAIGGINNANGNGGEPTAATIRGVMIASRTASNAQAGYVWPNTTAIGAAGSSATAGTSAVRLNSHTLYIGARNYEAFPPDNYSAFTCSGFEAGAGCDATRAQYIRDAWAQLQLDLTR